MRNGMTPSDAAQGSLDRIIRKYNSFSGAIVALNIKGE